MQFIYRAGDLYKMDTRPSKPQIHYMLPISLFLLYVPSENEQRGCWLTHRVNAICVQSDKMPRLSHSTLASSPDENGYKSRLDIDPLKKSIHGNEAHYEARAFLCEKGLSQRTVKARFQQDTERQHVWSTTELKKNKLTRKVTKKFTRLNSSSLDKNGNGNIHVLECQKATVDSVSSMDKQRRVGDHVIFEDSQKKEILFTDCDGKIKDEPKKKSLFSRQPKRKNSKKTNQTHRTYSVERFQPSEIRPSAPPLEDDLPPTYEECQKMEKVRRQLASSCDFNGNSPMLNTTFIMSEEEINNRLNNNTCNNILGLDNAGQIAWLGRQRSMSTCSSNSSSSQGDTDHNLQPSEIRPSAPPLEDDLPPTYEECQKMEKVRRQLVSSCDFNSNSPIPNTTLIVSEEEINNRLNNNTSNNILGLDNAGQLASPGRQRSTSTCSSNSSSSQEDTDHNPHPLLGAFIHYSLWESDGCRVFSDLKGTCDKEGNYILTTPTIHSVKREYGDKDEGVLGIQKVLRNHVCSEMCMGFPPVENLIYSLSANTRV